MSSVFQYLHSRFSSNNNNNNNQISNIITENGGGSSVNSRVVNLDVVSIMSEHNVDDDDDEEEEEDYDDEEEEEVSNAEMARYFQSFREKKNISTDLTFRVCRMQANDVQQQAGITLDDQKKRRTRSDEVPLIYNKKRQNIQTELEVESKPVEYDDKWLRILKGINRRNFNTGRKYRYIEERIWNNTGINSLPSVELPTID
ncbi:hypothetical protein, no similarity [Maudiozyma barnettii]|uniref:Uncharacterized protein n=1 Tax=Maudiozyma barnettii TaxID=61262 RepID=A0A8H2VG50_9SACH|nr:hypothetical protein, no similarity [Kazachstania barnettii]CAB4254564.1 hypothetical protein, no similarity [Kazachstania barnettii]CAD1782606.1 hypothetical protein, no similarity [Kazachstania barnettii]